ncbi:MAG TPA: hypothetical protein VK025_10560 [Steroidobacter sp.]|jgi:hypothetical protein|nr:hypothetical protein [Steroidobacteraceae bacterium]HLS81834.1 hypothetical protein [Steroidobacter sp.]
MRQGRQAGSVLTEYVAVLLGLMVVWRGLDAMLSLLREHYDEYAWTLMIPF